MEKFFKLKENGTSVSTEIMAGLTTFFAMSYIIVVNPSILSQSGMEWGAVFLATIIASIIGTLVMGLVANVPYAQAPGMGLNAFFVYTVCFGLGFTWQQALSMVFVCGVVNILITVTKVRKYIIKSIPVSLQNAIGGGIGIFVAYIGILNVGIITFDSGGISLKPGANMHAMKCDMTGAAIVLSVLAAVAEEQLPRRIVGIMACADNMPDGRATRPGDVVVAANGDSVEIQNTDAEGRLALCDALAYAQKEWTPAAIVDIATLTGACAVALGSEVAGLFCDDDALRERLQASATLGGEALWPLPLWKGYKENLKSEVADICHIGPREGGAIHAALFLQHFIQDGVRWAHLDIAGVDWASKPGPLTVIGGTAFGARTLLELARGGV